MTISSENQTFRSSRLPVNLGTANGDEGESQAGERWEKGGATRDGALRVANGNKSEAARLLKTDFKTLHEKTKRLGLARTDAPGA